MMRNTNHSGSFAKRIWSRKVETGMSRTLIGVLAALGAVGLVLFVRELPSLRRYLRIQGM